MPRSGQYLNESQKFSELNKDVHPELDSALPRSRHVAAAIAAITIVLILIYLKFFNH